MKRAPSLILQACAAALLLTGCATAGGGQEVAADMAEPGSAAARAELALRLAAQARRDRDPRAMLVAARMMLTSGTRPAMLEDGALVVEPGEDPLASAWAREAMALAGDNPALHEEAQAILAMRPRGVLRSSLGSGPLRYVQRIAANESVRFAIRTQPHSPARIAAIGDGDARIGLAVQSDRERVCNHGAHTTHSMCTWRASGDSYAVTLTNAGPLSSDVMLLSN